MFSIIGKWIANKQMAKFERDYDYDMSYAREMMGISWPAFRQFGGVAQLAAFSEDVPADALFAAKIVATLSEDCGPCTQLVVGMAERAGVGANVLKGIVAGDLNAMGETAALGYNFAKATLDRDLLELDRLRLLVVEKWGKRAVVSLALAVASSRVFPTVKYALGHGHACQQLKVAGSVVPVDRSALHA